MNHTFEHVRQLIANEFSLDPATIEPETPLVELGVDSLAALEFAFRLEEAFGVRFDDDVDLRGAAVRDLVTAVEAAQERARVRGEPAAA